MRTRKAGLWAKPHPEATALVSQADPPLLTTPLGIHAFSSWVPPRCPPVGSVWGMRPGTKALTRACGSFSGAPLAEATTQPHRLRVGAASPVQPHLQMGPPLRPFQALRKSDSSLGRGDMSLLTLGHQQPAQPSETAAPSNEEENLKRLILGTSLAV